MKLPPDARFEEDSGLFIWKPKGIINEAVVSKVIAYLGEKEATSKEPFDRFVDVVDAEGVDLRFQFVFDASILRRLTYSTRAPVKAAILVSDVNNAHYLKMHALLTQGSPLKIRLFEKRSEAATWLGVSEQDLEGSSEEAA